MINKYNGKWIYIDYLCPSKSGKTRIYQVMSKRGIHLGDIKWFSRWRKYAFFPYLNLKEERDTLDSNIEKCKLELVELFCKEGKTSIRVEGATVLYVHKESNTILIRGE